MGGGRKQIGYMFAKQFYWYKLRGRGTFQGTFPEVYWAHTD